MSEPNGWNEWSKHVLNELIRLNNCYESLNTKLEETKDHLNHCISKYDRDAKVEIAKLKVKSGVWGMLGGLIPALLLIGIYALRGS